MINDRSTNRQYEINHATLSEAIELVIDYRGKTPKKLGGDWSISGYRALSAKNIKTGSIVQPETIRYVDEDLYKKWMKDEVQRGDILITSEAPFGQIYYWDSDEKIVLSQRIFALRTKKEFCSKYLYYYMTTPEFQAELDARATGTTVIGLRQPELLKCKIKYPPVEVQRKIAGVLGALDDKIELNNKINQNLEFQAQALFSENLHKKSYPIKPLFDVATIKYGKGLPTNKLTKNGYKVFGGNGIIGYYSEYLYEQPQILISCRGAASGTILESHPFCYVTNNSLVVELTDRRYYEFLKRYLLLNQLHSYATGSAQPQITIDNLKGVEIPYPEYEDIKSLSEALLSISKNSYQNLCENEKLSTLRDTLLPKLMSGEINVDKVDISDMKE